MWFIQSIPKTYDSQGVMNVIYVADENNNVTAYHMTFTTRPTCIIIRPEKDEVDTDAQVCAFIKHSHIRIDDAKHDASQKGYYYLPDGFRYGTYLSYKNQIRHCVEFWSFPSIIIEEDQRPLVYQLKCNALYTFSCRDFCDSDALPSA